MSVDLTYKVGFPRSRDEGTSWWIIQAFGW